MSPNSETNGPVWASNKDPRITKVGNILRKSRIDELPQLWSVIVGDMSLIGPRPERPEIDKLLIREIPYYNYRNTIKPGISGWAQVNYRYGASVEDSQMKFSYEIFYLKNYSLLFDILIFMKTLKLVINLEGSSPK
jgi:lipopolysaccharide/colanic/teichoic acid biosynthesis glycosyltransferase